ncbi:hypothetical protein [Oceanicoccus sp. KOV_DT_Chl]|uniref:hypothetical protein n=1 Tax=Oceanicoccus sp. KOV_DT_Chl TaxID=1904639 RepID=UPI000C7CDEB2|nr:hypothetical protein [Oceanicoccus sp. KOV_DT_Chl]
MTLTKLTTSLVLLAACTQPNTVLAYTDAEIDQMLNILREENEALKQEIQQLKANDEQQPVLQERQVKARPSQQKYPQSTDKSVHNQNSRISLNGFISASATQSDPAVGDQNVSYRDDISFDTDSIAGLQARFKLNEKTDITIQMVARGAEDWELETEWAFISHEVTDALTLRAGRLRLPLYLFSESLEIGLSYPWARPPSDFYALPINNYEGVDALYNVAFGDWIHQFQFFAGSDNQSSYDTNDFYGANITSSSGAWTHRASAFTFDIEFSSFGGRDLPENINDGGTYYTLASMYDDGNWLLVTEISIYDTDQTEVFRDTDAGYITIGRYLGEWLPHITIGKSYTTNEPDFTPYPTFSNGRACLGTEVAGNCFGAVVDTKELSGFVTTDPLNFTSTAYSLGLRYNLSPNTSAKIEWNHYTELDNTAGTWNRLRFTGEADEIDDIDIYSIVLDVVF